MPNIRLASLKAGTLRQVLRTAAFNQAAHTEIPSAVTRDALRKLGRWLGE